MHRDGENVRVIELLDVDQDLARSVPEDEQGVARANLTVPALRLEPGGRGLAGLGEPDCVGLLLIEGFVTRDVEFAGRRSRELLGSGDLLRPWDLEMDFMPPFAESSFTVMEPSTLAYLDRRILRLGARWPDLVDQLVRRAMHRSRWLAIRLAIGSVNKVSRRLLLFFWHAAGRWGRVTPRGVELPFVLTHGVLAELVGARRPSVTTALTELQREGALITDRADRGTRFTLRREPPGEPVLEG